MAVLLLLGPKAVVVDNHIPEEKVPIKVWGVMARENVALPLSPHNEAPRPDKGPTTDERPLPLPSISWHTLHPMTPELIQWKNRHKLDEFVVPNMKNDCRPLKWIVLPRV